MKKWICSNAFSGQSNEDDGGLLHSLQSRIDSWKRSYFPLDVINRLIKDSESKKLWKKRIYERIFVLASDNNYYSIVDDVETIEFRNNKENDRLSVYITLKNSKELQVLTPCAAGEPREMDLANEGQLSIDHEIPLRMIVEHILEESPEIKAVLETINDIKARNPNSDAKGIAQLIKNEKDVELLKKLKDAVLEDTICIFMERGENSKKNSYTQYRRYRKDGNLYIMILDEDVCNPVDRQKYTIFCTLDNHKLSKIQIKPNNH